VLSSAHGQAGVSLVEVMIGPTLAGEMRCLAILVTTAGQIRMCDPAVAAPDPRAC
jgi:hypothetical protein